MNKPARELQARMRRAMSFVTTLEYFLSTCAPATSALNATDPEFIRMRSDAENQTCVVAVVVCVWAARGAWELLWGLVQPGAVILASELPVLPRGR